MPRVIEGMLNAEGLSFAVVVARFNHVITDRLLEGALDALVRHGAQDEDITVVRVPGAWEVPGVAARLARSGKIHAVICLAAVIRGGTPHFEYVAAEVSKGVAQAGLNGTVPVTFGVLTTDSLEQAIERAGSKGGNKGAEAALAAIELARVFQDL
ncbi:MAG: 6,7-dimethyl-8-ribityllumazine synthase [Deltaproteobacteria bacterium]|nr:6,7-dimethyl-8-ribityllumazine synthase [Deltaproteobacteria bacterium]